MRGHWHYASILVIVALLQCTSWSETRPAVPPPLPLLPIPTASQLKWQRREVIMFFHFGMNTFTDSEWGTGRESPTLFDPPTLDAQQWIDAAAGAAGVSLAILVAKHHDGFCLWPSAYTDHSVRSSPWEGGAGDVVREFVNAAAARGVDAGLYLSPWDRHERSYGREVEYNEHYLAQLRELLGNYGSVSEIWFDGAKGKKAKNMTYYFEDWFQVTKQLQGSINIFSDAGPDIRWVGDEQGFAGSTCWSTINRRMLRIGDASLAKYLNTGEADGTDWVPPECDVSIRKGWFWHKDQKPKNLTQLLDIYYKSVGRNCVLLLNVPPNSTGLVSDADVSRLRQFREAIDTIFSTDLARGATAWTSNQRGGRHGGFDASKVIDGDELSYWAPESRDESSVGDCGKEHWIELEWEGEGASFNVVAIQEPIWMGQRIQCHEVYADGVLVANGTTVGHKRLHRLKAAVVGAKRVRLRILRWRDGGEPLVSKVGVHFDPYWKGQWGTYEAEHHPS